MEAIRPSLASLRLHAPRRARPLYQCLHTSSSRYAQPLPQPSVPGPPPDAPKPSPADALARVERKRKQAALLKQAQEVRSAPTKPTYALQKRFWQDVSVQETDDGLQVFLDKRPVRTPTKEILTVPASKHQLATAIALEWDLLVSAQQALKTHYIPMTSLAARAVDIAKADAAGNSKPRDDIIRMLMRYLSTDTLLCWAPEKSLHDPENVGSLRDLQIDISTPIIAYLTTHVWPGVEIKPILEPDSIMPIDQPEMTKSVLIGWLSGLPAFELAGLERAVLASKSLLVGVRLIHEWAEAFADVRGNTGGHRFGIEEAAEAASTEVRWQTRQWGEVEDTHDVEKEDMKRQLGSVILLVGGDRT
ncbi:ATP12-domain-containing protein [Aaosphaeria arxii CBS 175.79]|uniref:ATP12-domain-containing protein n=1 Tax=Aaosphaeria arxii CBS 175.79 TaxID=1450172 RepID=A0A6A5XEC3_9PLEO|nr:ATP12-domain-containing protein [Aaosphaeria arxii CBS 175.79]KAF2011176.1 ATP12-domain-containing protein [Aaosphaeria arxii CBS 175.79]